MPELSASEWEVFLSQHPEAHLLQTAAWGELKSAFGWRPVRVLAHQGNQTAGAQILFRNLPLGLSVAYIPKGPVGKPEPAHLWDEVDSICKRSKAILLKVEPDEWEGPASANPPEGFQTAQHAIQPQRTLLVNLAGDEEQVLARMKQKTRYNIRLAQKKGVVVKTLGGYRDVPPAAAGHRRERSIWRAQPGATTRWRMICFTRTACASC